MRRLRTRVDVGPMFEARLAACSRSRRIQHPWHVFIPYGGYYQLLPRVIAQFTQYLPLAQASRLFAVCGALIASGCGLFIFHASAGHVRAVPLRAMLGAAVVLMQVAVMEIAVNAVCAPWYLMLATF